MYYRSPPETIGQGPGSTFIDRLLRYEADCKMLVLLGEVGGGEVVKSGKIKKPIVACTCTVGTYTKMLMIEVQFGQAGAMAISNFLETADAKNSAMRTAGFIVPDTLVDGCAQRAVRARPG